MSRSTRTRRRSRPVLSPGRGRVRYAGEGSGGLARHDLERAPGKAPQRSVSGRPRRCRRRQPANGRRRRRKSAPAPTRCRPGRSASTGSRENIGAGVVRDVGTESAPASEPRRGESGAHRVDHRHALDRGVADGVGNRALVRPEAHRAGSAETPSGRSRCCSIHAENRSRGGGRIPPGPDDGRQLSSHCRWVKGSTRIGSGCSSFTFPKRRNRSNS